MKKLLIVVDYQKDFVDGALGFQGAEKLEGPIVEKIKKYRENSDEVVFTFDTHGQGYMETLEGKDLPVAHCIKDSEGWELYGKVKEALLDEDVCFTKNTFGSVELMDYLRNKEYSNIELVGLVSNICVLSNAIIAKTALPEVPITVDGKCTASFDAELNEKVFDVLEGINIRITNREKKCDA